MLISSIVNFNLHKLYVCLIIILLIADLFRRKLVLLVPTAMRARLCVTCVYQDTSVLRQLLLLLSLFALKGLTVLRVP